ncbi:Crp/Fnr family transcriptional regulator [Maricaulis sp.]|uniref:Crp/Fnr family transcriptional regulator n=1 Tax=Maricaulis sp. TaxID=1486257 RepID=UPI002635F98F|nr:Crp/Fnr family transcriptional regulator [Maricaulis sp.]
MDSRPFWPTAFERLGIHDAQAEAALIAAAEIRSVASGSVIIAQDDDDDMVFIILDGEARVVLLSASGQEIWIDALQAGAVIGELAVLTEQRRTSEIIAEQDCMLACFPARDFLALSADHGALGLALARVLAQRVHHTTQRMFELSALSATGRVYAELLRISEPSESGETRYIRPKPTWTVLAQKVNTSRETASRTISDLEKRGLLRRLDDGFELVDPDQLSRLSSTN